MSDIDTMLADTATRFFADLCTREVLETQENGLWLADAWHQTCEMGLASAASMPMDDDVIGLPLASLCKLAQLAGYFSLPLPLVETFIAQRALLRVGMSFEESEPLALSTLAQRQYVVLQRVEGSGDYEAHGVVRRVAWGRHSPHTLVLAEMDGRQGIAHLPTPEAVRHGANLAGEPRDTLIFEGTKVAASRFAPLHEQDLEQVLQEGALLRAQQMVGAMQRALDMTITYALEREQFGRPIAKFQAIQQQIAEQAGQTASATAAAEAAAHASIHRVAPLPVAMAKTRAGEAATQVCAIAHQVHGAMGFTHEHMLHLSSRRLLSWRDEFGSDKHWAAWMGGHLQQLGDASLWDFITDSSRLISQPAVEETAA